jgi:hypothetical protein
MPIITAPTDKLVIPLDGFSTYGWSGSFGNVNNYDTGTAFPFVPQETFTLTTIIFYYRVNTAPSPNTWTVGVQYPNVTNGKPSDTFQTSASWICPSSGAGFAEAQVPSFTMIKGTFYWIVINNGGLGSSGNVSIFTSVTDVTINRINGMIFKSNNIWNAGNARNTGNFWLYSGTKYYGPSCLSLADTDTARISPNESGTTFKLPVDHPTITLKSMLFNLSTFSIDTIYSVKVRDASRNLLTTATFNGNFNSSSFTFTFNGVPTTYYSFNLPYFEFDTPVDFNANTKYYITFTGTTGTPPLLRYSTNLNAQLMTDVRNGIEAHFVTYDGTTYTEFTNRTCQGYLLFDEIKYEQLGGTTIYSSSAGFNQLDF